jgi:hypothetical protein
MHCSASLELQTFRASLGTVPNPPVHRHRPNRRNPRMFRNTRRMTAVRRMGATALAAVILGLGGCQPEGTGTVKAPGPRGDDSMLGRPFGNAPELPKPKNDATGKATKEVVQPVNPRL